MPLFLDSSAVTKIFVEESGSTEVMREITRTGGVFHVAFLAILEFTSAVCRRAMEGRLSGAETAEFRDQFNLMLNERAKTVPYSDVLLRHAVSLIERHGAEGLRSLDALHLASCLEVPGAVLGTGDRALAAAARREGVEVLVFG